jgi:tRNA threonylcarbamoyladenosine biosynthesis protein TsaB
MKILALELSTVRGSLAFVGDEAEVAREWPNDRKNSALFFKHLSDVRKQFGSPNLIIVGLGPGSYAGTRIALSAAIGLQMACGARLVGLPSICAMESSEPEYWVTGDARSQTFFFARLRNREILEGPTLMSEEELHTKLKEADKNVPILATDELPRFDAEIRYPSAQVLASLAQDPNRSFVLSPLEPIYLREPHITVPKSI